MFSATDPFFVVGLGISLRLAAALSCFRTKPQAKAVSGHIMCAVREITPESALASATLADATYFTCVVWIAKTTLAAQAWR